MSTFLNNIGNSADIRRLVSQTDIDNTTVSLLLDRLRTLEVITKTKGRGELTVRCHDTEQRVSVVLHLPYQEGAVASATIIDHTESSST